VSAPVFNSVIDLGLRDVGVANQPRRLAALLGRFTVPAFAAAIAYALIACLAVRSAGASPLLVALAWPAIMLIPVMRVVKRAPVLVLKVTADGRNQATWLVLAHSALVLVAMVLVWNPVAIPVLVPVAAMTLLAWRARGRIPEVLRMLRSALGAGEPVLGDGLGLARDSKYRNSLRVTAATGRRLLVAGQTGMLLDLPYDALDHFGVEWKLGGRTGTLKLTAGGVETVIASFAPANLLSIAQALWSHGVPTDDPAAIEEAQRGWEAALARPARARRLTRIATAVLVGVVGLVVTASAAGFPLSSLPLAVQVLTAKRLPVDGRSDLTGGAASLAYTPGPGLRELRRDEHWNGGPDDGARWELRSSVLKGDNVISLSHYIFLEPRLDDPAAVAGFVAGKDREQSAIAGFTVRHQERVVDGRTGYVWQYRSHRGYWQFAAWFPQPVHSVRVECIARAEADRFKRLCGEAMASLRFRR
jgi:hypothetical protein